MKIRYYLRGLGIGILFTSIFFLVSNGSSNQTMSDEQIKARAKELGMTESTVLADIVEKETIEETVEETVEAIMEESTVEEVSFVTETEEATTTEEMTETVVEETVEEVVEESSQAETVDSEAVQETDNTTEIKEEQNTAPNTSPVTIMVNRGEGSDTVSRRLQEAGLVADAYEYDRYLMANGYDKRIGAGEHVIPAGATWEEIAKVLCN